MKTVIFLMLHIILFAPCINGQKGAPKTTTTPEPKFEDTQPYYYIAETQPNDYGPYNGPNNYYFEETTTDAPTTTTTEAPTTTSVTSVDTGTTQTQPTSSPSAVTSSTEDSSATTSQFSTVGVLKAHSCSKSQNLI